MLTYCNNQYYEYYAYLLQQSKALERDSSIRSVYPWLTGVDFVGGAAHARAPPIIEERHEFISFHNISPQKFWFRPTSPIFLTSLRQCPDYYLGMSIGQSDY